MLSKNRDYPYYPLSLFYLFFFIALGSFVPYWPLYLEDLGFSPAQIGELMAIGMASRIVSPYLWGWLADHSGHRIQIIRLTAFLSAFIFAGIFMDETYYWVALIMASFGFFWNACLPLFEGLTLDYLGERVTKYSHIRIWGSIGFILAVLGLQLGFDAYGYQIIPIALFVFLLLTLLATFLVADKKHLITSSMPQTLGVVIRRPVVIAFLVVCTLQVASHGAYYTFLSIYLKDYGYSSLMIGWMWALGVIAEVLLFMVMHRVLKRYDAGMLLALALLGTALRWVLLAYFVDVLVILLLIQILHAISFGLFHAVAIHLLHDLFPKKLQSRGQALYAGLCFGGGGAVGSLFSGYSWDSIGALATFLLSGLVALLGGFIAWKFIAKNEA